MSKMRYRKLPEYVWCYVHGCVHASKDWHPLEYADCLNPVSYEQDHSPLYMLTNEDIR